MTSEPMKKKDEPALMSRTNGTMNQWVYFSFRRNTKRNEQLHNKAIKKIVERNNHACMVYEISMLTSQRGLYWWNIRIWDDLKYFSWLIGNPIFSMTSQFGMLFEFELLFKFNSNWHWSVNFVFYFNSNCSWQINKCTGLWYQWIMKFYNSVSS